MDAITIHAVVGADRKLTIDVPEDVPLGPVTVVIQTAGGQRPAERPLTREEARRILLEAGFLVTDFGLPQDAVALTQAEIDELGKLPPGARPSDELIDEDRGEY